MQLSGKRIAILVDNLYQEMEVWYPVYRLREGGAEVVTVGAKAGETYTSKHGYPIHCDKSYTEVSASQFDGVVVPGGYAPDIYHYGEGGPAYGPSYGQGYEPRYARDSGPRYRRGRTRVASAPPSGGGGGVAAPICSGDTQGLSDVAEASSESVEELVQEGQSFEAEVISGIENAPDADEAEVTTHEVPEDDVPPEYLNPEQD